MKTSLSTLLLSSAAVALTLLAVQVDAATDQAADISSETIDKDYFSNHIEWFQSQKGSYYSPKIMYTESSKIVALAPIAKGEQIIHVPAELFITANMDSDNGELNNNIMCDTAWNLAEEYVKGKDSRWNPLISYWFNVFRHEHHPSFWSDEALQLFDAIVGDHLEPQNFGDRGSYEEECWYDGEEETNDVVEAAYRIVVARGQNGILVPVVDVISHRNGEWKNVHQVGSAQIGENVSVVALRDIEEGEQIYSSLNECPGLDCEGKGLTFTMPQILAERGYVEPSPIRFNIAAEHNRPVFEMDKSENGKLEITWLDGEPTKEDLEWFRDELDRLDGLVKMISEDIKDLKKYERKTIAAYYDNLHLGLTIASSCEDASTYRALEDHTFDLYHRHDVCPNRGKVPGIPDSSEDFESAFQGIEFWFFDDEDEEELDTCLYLDGWLHMCNSLRPHYHEWFVHHATQFLKQVKRVLFLGGGDNMILHEVLKYPDLELVIGMELDPMVVRTSFKHFKISPHYDGKVEWWFGDAAKSLKMLPDEYLGTFDLVVVDLLTYVTESLMVTDELNILDFSMLLLNEGGILTMNDDFTAPTKGAHAKYSIDLQIMDVPVFCQLSVRMLSNTVDFMLTEPIDHGIENMVVKIGESKNDSQKFDSWWNYHRNDDHKVKERKAKTVNASDNTQGIMSVLEAEDVSIAMESMTDVRDTITKSLQKIGLQVLASSSFEKETLIVNLKEGYIMARSWLEHKYIAFDIVLWSKRDALVTAKTELVNAVGAKSSSSYNIVIGGMRGVEAAELATYPPAKTNSDSTSCASDTPSKLAFDPDDLDVILRKMTALAQSTDPVTVVFCPEMGKLCRSLKVLQDKGSTVSEQVLPVWACASGDSMHREVDCEKATLDVMKSAVSQGMKISGIVIDPETPRKMGHVLKKVLSISQTQKEILSQQYIVLAPEADDSVKLTWRRALLEWFRTDVAIMNPDYHAEVLFNRTSCSENVRMSTFSAGDEDFYSHLVQVIEQCESEISGLTTMINSVQGGKHKYMADFDPPIVADESSYDKSAAEDQWKSQNPLAMQTVTQFELKMPLAPVYVDEIVLGKYDVHPLTGKWLPATIKSINVNGTFDIVYEHGTLERRIPRSQIRKWEIVDSLSDSETVLARSRKGVWLMGKVLETMPDNQFKVHLYNGFGLVETIPLENMMQRHEKPEKVPLSEVSCPLLKEMLQNGVRSVSANDPKTHTDVHDGTGDGCVVTAFWSQGNAVATWDGGHHMDLNIFTFEEKMEMHKKISDTFIGMTSSFAIVSKNWHPRGFGRVVNFKDEMKDYYSYYIKE